MDRVLLVIDDIQYAGHLEMTLRKVGFDLETLTNEYNLQEKLLTFNPDYVIVKGIGTRVSAMNVGKKLKESTKFLGKVILIFPEDQKSTPDEFIKLRMDLLLFEPISALRVVTHLLNLTQLDKDAVLEKLLRFANTDVQFRAYESQILKSTGSTIDSEIKIITGDSQDNAQAVNEELNTDELLSFGQTESKQNKVNESVDSVANQARQSEKNLKQQAPKPEESIDSLNKADFDLKPDFLNKLKAELKDLDQELPLRIEAYNRAIKGVDQNLKLGLSKRQTRKTNRKLFQDIMDDDNKIQDAERRRFVKALVKK